MQGKHIPLLPLHTPGPEKTGCTSLPVPKPEVNVENLLVGILRQQPSRRGKLYHVLPNEEKTKSFVQSTMDQ